MKYWPGDFPSYSRQDVKNSYLILSHCNTKTALPHVKLSSAHAQSHQMSQKGPVTWSRLNVQEIGQLNNGKEIPCHKYAQEWDLWWSSWHTSVKADCFMKYQINKPSQSFWIIKDENHATVSSVAVYWRFQRSIRPFPNIHWNFITISAPKIISKTLRQAGDIE